MTTDELHQILSETEVEQETREKILRAAKQLEEEKKADKVTTPRAKKQWVVVLKTPQIQSDQLQVDINESVAHVFQIPEDADPNEMLENIKKAGIEQNLTVARKKVLIEDFDDVTNIKRKFLKEENVDLKSKDDWVRVIPLPAGFEFGGYESPKFD